MCDAKQRGNDETAYLLKSSANRERLLKAIENVTQNRNLVTVKQEKHDWKEQLRRDVESIREEVQKQGGINAEIIDDTIKRYRAGKSNEHISIGRISSKSDAWMKQNG